MGCEDTIMAQPVLSGIQDDPEQKLKENCEDNNLMAKAFLGTDLEDPTEDETLAALSNVSGHQDEEMRREEPGFATPQEQQEEDKKEGKAVHEGASTKAEKEASTEIKKKAGAEAKLEANTDIKKEARTVKTEGRTTVSKDEISTSTVGKKVAATFEI